MNDAQTLFNEGVTALQAGQMDKARRLLARSIAIEPLNEHAWLFLSLTLPDNKAADALERVLRINPANASAQAALDAVNKRLGKETTPAGMAAGGSQNSLEQGNKPTQKFNSIPPARPAEPRIYVSVAPPSPPAPHMIGNETIGDVPTAQLRIPAKPTFDSTEIPLFQDAGPSHFPLPDWMEEESPYIDLDSHSAPTHRNGHSYQPVTRSSRDATPSATWAESADGSFDPADSPDADAALRQALLEPVVFEDDAPRVTADRSQRMDLTDDVRRRLDEDLREMRRRKRKPGLLIVLVLLIMVIIAVAINMVIGMLSNPVVTVQPTAVVLASQPTSAPRPTDTAIATPFPTSTPNPIILPTETPLPPPKDIALMLGQEVAVDGYVVRPEIYSPNSPDFSALGADPPLNGMHYEGIVVMVANQSERVMPLALGFFQGVDDKTQRVTALQKGRLPNLDVQRLQPGEQRRAWLTFAVNNGDTLRSVVFQASTTRAVIDVTQTAKTPPKAGPTPKTPAVSDGSIGSVNDTPIPSTPDTANLPQPVRYGMNEKAQAGGFNISVTSYDSRLPTTVIPRLLPAAYHYEIVRVTVENISNNSNAATLLSRAAAGFVLRDNTGLLFTEGPVETTARFRYEDFATVAGKPGKSTVSGSLYFLVRDSAGPSRTLQFYPTTDFDVSHIEFTIK